MIVSQVETLLRMSDGTVPEAVQGTITKLYPQKKTGGGTLMQNGTLSGDDGSMIALVLMGRPKLEPVEWVGCRVYLTAKSGTRGLSGLKRRDNPHDPKNIKPELWVYENGDIAIEDGGEPKAAPAQTPPPRQSQPQQQQRTQPQPRPAGTAQSERDAQTDESTRAPKEQPKPGSPADVQHVRGGVMQLANLYETCFNAAGYLTKTRLDVDGGADIQKDIATTLFIQASKQGLQHRMPAAPLPERKKKTETPEQAEQ